MGREISYHFIWKLQRLQDRWVLTVCKWTEIFYSHRYNPILSNLAMDWHGKTVCSGEALSLQRKFTISDTDGSSISTHISKHCLYIRGLGTLDNKYGRYLWLKGEWEIKDVYFMWLDFVVHWLEGHEILQHASLLGLLYVLTKGEKSYILWVTFIEKKYSY